MLIICGAVYLPDIMEWGELAQSLTVDGMREKKFSFLSARLRNEQEKGQLKFGLYF